MRDRERFTLSLVFLTLLVFVGISSAGFATETSRLGDKSHLAAIPAADSDYCSYFGGSAQEDATKVTFDNDGNTILIGQTQSTDLPITEDAFQSSFGGGEWDAFVAKFSEAGELLWASYLGGNGYEHVTAVNVDTDNNIVLAGTTQSSNFQTTAGVYQTGHGGAGDGFVMKLSPSGEVLFTTLLGGSGEDWIYGMEFDAEGNYLFGGFTSTSGLATVGAHKSTLEGIDAFAARLSSDGTALEMFTYIGGASADRGWTMTVDSEYNYLISGVTTSSDLDVSSNAYQEAYGGSTDGYIAYVANNGSAMMYLTYFGGSEEDMGLGVDFDSDGNLILAGPTESDDLDVVNAMQSTYAGGNADNFVAKFTPNGEAIFVTYIGGNSTDRTWDARVTPDDTIVIVGRSLSLDYPTINGLQLEKSGNYDAIATELSSDGQTILRSSFLGGASEDIGEGIEIDSDGSVVITGRSSSTDLLTTSGAYQETSGGGRDVFVCHTIFDAVETTPTSTTEPPPADLDPIPTAIIIAIVVVVVAIVIGMKKR